MQRLGPTKKGKAVSVLIVSATGLSLCTEQRVDFVQEMGDWSVRADHPQRSQFHPTNLFLSLNLWCKDLVPQKKGKAVSVLIVSATGLSLCTEQRVGLVQEMGDWSVRADHPQRSQFHPTNLFLSLNLWCKDLVPQKKGKAVSVLIVSATGLSLCTEQRVDFVQEMGD